MEMNNYFVTVLFIVASRNVFLSELQTYVYRLPGSQLSAYFFLNKQSDALIIQILFCYKTLHLSGIFAAHHQEFSTVHLALVSFIQVFDDRFQAESGWNTVPSLLCLEVVIKNLY